ncbi:MAG: Rha family transcriptional regulator [Turicibacter sanguinis]|uniref:Rha family transcriptional regulator n=1 Tax=Turicibacter sanguinis TaxID=154288 RepID=UPI0039928660
MSGEIKLNVSQSRGYESASLINIENKDGVAVVSSRVIAYDFDKQHKHVLESIDNLIKAMGGAEKLADLYIESKYQHPQNKQWYKEYLLTRDGFSLLVMGFTGKEALHWKLQYIEAFNKMEMQIKQQQKNPYSHPSKEFQALIMHDEKIMKLERRVEDIEDNAYLSPSEYGMVGQKVNNKIHAIVTERGLKLSRQQRSELYKSLNRDIKTITGVHHRCQLRRKHLDQVLEFIYRWEPSLATMMKVEQMDLFNTTN